MVVLFSSLLVVVYIGRLKILLFFIAEFWADAEEWYPWIT
jgi:hypothetical protein